MHPYCTLHPASEKNWLPNRNISLVESQSKEWKNFCHGISQNSYECENRNLKGTQKMKWKTCWSFFCTRKYNFPSRERRAPSCCVDTGEQQGWHPAQVGTLRSSRAFPKTATPGQKDIQRQRPPPGQLQQAWSRTTSLLAAWDCCTLGHGAFKWEWVQRNALQLMTFPTLTRKMEGELKPENLVQGNELLFPTGFVF